MSKSRQFQVYVLFIVLTLGVFICPFSTSAAWQNDASPLAPGAPIERDISGQQTHAYRIALSAGQFFQASIQQKGIDVIVTLLGPDGQKLDESSEPVYDNRLGQILFIAKSAGDHHLLVRPRLKDGAPGLYQVCAEIVRPATEPDQIRARATRLTKEANYTLGNVTALSIEEAPKVAGKFEEVLQLWRLLGDTRMVGESFLSLGIVNHRIREYTKALALYERALPLFPQTPEGAASKATALNNMADAYLIRREAAGRQPAAKMLAVLADPVFEANDPRLAAAKKKPSANGLIASVRSAESSSAAARLPAELARSVGSFQRDGFGRLLFSKTDASIKEVFAVLPFGETLPLKFLPGEGVWETRFLAPAWMPDGTYRCRLPMTDKQGRGYQEEKSFVVDSHAPRLAVRAGAETVRAGDELIVRATADRDTMRLVAKLYGAQPVQLAWSEKEKASIGRLRVPAALASGPYTLTVSAEDFAHNQSSVELQIAVIGR